jgi:hypothetical protein
MISCLVPPRVFLTNKAPYVHIRDGSSLEEALLLGVFSSVPFDWYARRFVELGMNFFILNSLPIPINGPSQVLERLTAISGSLASSDDRFSTWAQAVGVPVGTLKEEDERNEAIYELDALVALAYGLDREQVEHIFETFHRGWDYQPRLTRVLEFYDQWKGKA